MKKRYLALLLAAVMALLAGCSNGDGGSESTVSLHVVVAATYVSDEMVEALKTELATLTDYPDIQVTALAMGDPDTDPTGTMAGMTRISAMMAAGEVELLLADADNARRYGDNGDSYIALSEMFTEDEIAAFAAEPTGVPTTDDDGNLTGEESAHCGVLLTETASQLAGLLGLQMHVLSNTAHMDAAKAAFALLAGME